MSGEPAGDDGLVLNFNFGGLDKSAAASAEAKQKAILEKMQKREEERRKKEEERKRKKESGEAEDSDSKPKPKVASKTSKATKTLADSELILEEDPITTGASKLDDIPIKPAKIAATPEEPTEEYVDITEKPIKPKANISKPAPKASNDDLPVGGSKKSAAAAPVNAAEKPIGGGFDEDRPLNSKAAFAISEYPEGDGPPAESLDDGTIKIQAKGAYNLDDIDESNPFGTAVVEDEATLRKGPVEVRAVDKKSVKKRMYAFQDLLEIAKTDITDPVFNGDVIGKFHAYMDETNPAAFEAALELVSYYIMNGGKSSGYSLDGIIKQMIEKGFTSSKPTVKSSVQNLLDFFFKKGQKDDIFSSISAIIIKSLSVWKYVVAAFDALKFLLERNGPQKMDLCKPLLPACIKACGSTKPQSKDAAIDFLKECILYIGPVFLTLVDGLNKVQVKVLEDFVKLNPVPTKGPKKSAPKGATATGPAEEEDDAPMQVGMDAYDIATPVDIFKTFNEQFFEAIFAMTKWDQKKAKLDEFLEKGRKTPRFANVSVGWISNIVKRLFMDPNKNVQKATLAVLGVCAKGMRKHFSAIAKKEVGGLLLKFRESGLIDDIFGVLTAFGYCLRPDEVIEEIVVALKEKHIGVKTNTIDWLVKAIQLNSEGTDTLADKLLPTLVPMLDEGDKGVREAVSKLIGLFVFTCGEDRFNKFLGKVAAPKMKSVQKYIQEFEKSPPQADSGKSDPKKAAATKQSTATSAPSKQNGMKASKFEEATDEPVASPPTKPAASKPGPRKKFDDLAEESPSSKVVDAPRLAEPNMNIDEVEIKLRDMEFDDAVLKNLGSSNWEVKKDALSSTLGWLSDNAGFSEEVMILIKDRTKDFSFAHTQFNKELFAGLMSISEDLECKKKLFNEANVRIMLELCLERMNEKTYVSKIQDLLIRGFSTVNPKATISTMLDMIKKRTLGPKLVEVLTEILPKIISVVTINFLPTNELINFAKYTFEQKQSTHRKIGTIIVCGLYAMAGPKIKDYLQDINSSILTTLEAELKKVNVNLKAMPSIEIFGNKASIPAGDVISALPVSDVSSTLNNLVPSLEHNNWQKRKEALEAAASTLVEAGFNIKPAGLDSFLTAIVKRLEDSNKAPLKIAIDLSGGLAKSLGKHFKPWVKQMLPSLIKNLQDKQSSIREDVVRSIQAMYDAVDSEQDYIIKEMFNNLGHESTDLKQEILAFLAAHSEGLACVDFKPNLMDFLMKGIENRSKPIRDGFETLFKLCVEAKGEEIFNKAIVSLPPASQKNIKALLSKQADGGEAVEPAPAARLSVAQPKRTAVPAESTLEQSGIAEVSQAPAANLVYSMYGGIPTKGDQGSQKMIVTSGERKKRLAQNTWSLDGPTDVQLTEFHLNMNKHFHSKLVKGMFSLETESFHSVDSPLNQAINEIHKVMQGETEIFMDVQDLVLQWIFLRSFELRPQLTTFYIQFLAELMTKYAGTGLLTETERTLVISSCVQLYITCHRYVDASYFHNLVALITANNGWNAFFYVLEWNVKENQIIERFHMDHIVELAALGIKFVPGAYLGQLAHLTKAVIGCCYGKKSPDLLRKCFELLSQMYMLNPEVMEAHFPDQQDQAIVAIRHIVERGGLHGMDLQGSSLAGDSASAGWSTILGNSLQGGANNGPIRNEVVELPGLSPEGTDYEDQEEAAQDAHNGDSMQMSMRGQLESFMNTFLRCEEPQAMHYLQLLDQWLLDPFMLGLVSENANPIVENLIRYLQQVCAGIDPTRLKLYLPLVESLDKIATMERVVKSLVESTVFELLDTLLYILIITNDYKAKFVEKSMEFQNLSMMVTTLNSTILKVISNGDCNIVYATLFELLIKSRMEAVPEKFDGLVSKCIMKITQRIAGVTEQIDLEAILVKMHMYLTTLALKNIDLKDEIGVRIVKTALKELIEKYDDDVVLNAYKNVYREVPEEPHLSKWLKQLLKNKTRDQTLSDVTEMRSSVVPGRAQTYQQPPVAPNRETPIQARRQIGHQEPMQRTPTAATETVTSLDERRKLRKVSNTAAAPPETRSRNKSPLNKQAVNEYYGDYAEQTEEPIREYQDEKENLSSQIYALVNKIRSPSLIKGDIPKITRELKLLLQQSDESFDIPALLADCDSKLRRIVLQSFDEKFTQRTEEAPTPNELSSSKYSSLNHTLREEGLSQQKAVARVPSMQQSKLMTRGGLSSNAHSQKQMVPLSQSTVGNNGSVAQKTHEALRRAPSGTEAPRKH